MLVISSLESIWLKIEGVHILLKLGQQSNHGGFSGVMVGLRGLVKSWLGRLARLGCSTLIQDQHNDR